ncbi:MAG TPA: tetratricopeptide repeat protein [Gemmatimonadota bacterium]|nr:tetratricopeptide repeat protein [Gemmatimonadota bacterium]
MTGLPSGTITFLATDIQGSTDLWERYRGLMPSVLDRHDDLLREAFESRGGHVFKNTGDGLFTAFAAAPPAVAAALAAQRALGSTEWPVPEPVRVRMAIHSGSAETRGGDYFGPPVNRVARILSAGHGGQILLSQSVERLASRQFPEGAALRDLGLRSLKDLTEPERLFQLVTADLPADFPPLKTLDARPHNLPAQTTPLIGRVREVEDVRGLIQEDAVRLVTLLGPGGTGKTRLGLQVAAELIDDYRDGVWLVNLAPVHDPQVLAATILKVWGESPGGDASAQEALEAYLRGRELLLVLDNFEQVVEAAPVVSRVLRAAAGVNVLITSQAALRIEGEHEYPVAPLALPGPRESDPDRLVLNDAVSLFVSRARAVQPSFALSRDNAGAIVSITRQLDGLPLAIELAAARIKLFTPGAMLARLERQFDFLTTGGRDRPDRHRTLKGAIDWSYALLGDEERKVFERMAVFDGGFTLEAAETVLTTPDEGLDVLEALSSLIDKSLLRQVATAEDEPRFERLRTIYAFATVKLEASGEADVWRRRHAEYFADLAEGTEPGSGPDVGTGARLRRLEHEYENLRAAMSYALNAGAARLAVRLAQALPALWFTRGMIEEGASWLERVLELGDRLSDLDRAIALNLHGRLAQIRGDNSPEVVHRFEESLELFRQTGHTPGIARALMNLGNVRSRAGDYAGARRLFEESRELYQEVKDPVGVGSALLNLGDVCWAENDEPCATRYFEEARRLAGAGGYRIGYAFSIQYLGRMALQAGDLDRAAGLFAECREIFESLNARPGLAWTILCQAGIAGERGDLAGARRLLLDGLERFDELRYSPGISEALLGCGLLAAREERAVDAARLLGAAERLREGAALSRSPLERGFERKAADLASAALGPDAFERERAAGRALPVAEALALARGGEALQPARPVPEPATLPTA